MRALLGGGAGAAIQHGDGQPAEAVDAVDDLGQFNGEGLPAAGDVARPDAGVVAGSGQQAPAGGQGQRAAEQLKVSGFVRNLWDGRVEVFAMGTTEQHKELRRQLERGPFGSDVTEVREEPATIESQYENMFVINPSA